LPRHSRNSATPPRQAAWRLRTRAYWAQAPVRENRLDHDTDGGIRAAPDEHGIGDRQAVRIWAPSASHEDYKKERPPRRQRRTGPARPVPGPATGTAPAPPPAPSPPRQHRHHAPTLAPGIRSAERLSPPEPQFRGRAPGSV